MTSWSKAFVSLIRHPAMLPSSSLPSPTANGGQPLRVRFGAPCLPAPALSYPCSVKFLSAYSPFSLVPFAATPRRCMWLRK